MKYFIFINIHKNMNFKNSLLIIYALDLSQNRLSAVTSEHRWYVNS
jgi:hypothetical protein